MPQTKLTELTNLRESFDNGWLWPPIADAVKTFLRRRSNGDYYEQIWRLIHVWESISTTLCNVAVAKISSSSSELDEHGTTELQRIRELLHGVRWDENVERMRPIGLGAIAGSNEKRLEILRLILKSKSLKFQITESISHFCRSQCAKAETDQMNFESTLLRFRNVWHRVCDGSGPKGEKKPMLIDCIASVNQFRNRFAHVPFPSDHLKELKVALEELTELMFSVEPLPSRHTGSALTGCIMLGHEKWHGDRMNFSEPKHQRELSFGFPSREPSEIWSAGPFAFVDENQRAYIMTRLIDSESCEFEFTRYFTEGNSVVTKSVENGLSWIPTPNEGEFKRVDEEESKSDPYGSAIAAIRQKRFEQAIPILQTYLEKNPNYHVGWQQLGYALRERSRQITDHDAHSHEAQELLTASVDALTRAGEHSVETRKARAMYHRSKTHHRMFQLTGNSAQLALAIEDAKFAKNADENSEYRSWLGYVENFVGSD